ncbi:hypothetical protein [Kitasatospora sp. NPDC088346]|uniref:hypothetical protein n=1 Tax=Kitasatospora sp. NPDC088346 TaxID=3364073 RepID=UPI00381481FE
MKLQERWSLLVVYQLLRMAVVDAVSARPGRDLDRAGFTSCLETACNQVVNAACVLPQGERTTSPLRSDRPSPLTCFPLVAPHTRSRTLKAAHSRYQRRRP